MDNKVLQIPIEDIIPNRFQPRLSFDDTSLKELADSIKQHGIIQPLVLRRVADKYEIIAGERRYKAAMMAGLTSVPAIITELDDNASAEVAIVENVQRKDLTAIEEAKSYKALLDKGYMTQDDLAKKMGLSQAAISNKLRLLSLDEAVQDAILNEKISERHARSLLKIKDLEEQRKMLNRVITERLTVRQLEEEIKKMNLDETNLEIKEDQSVPSENVSSENINNNSVNDSVNSKPFANIFSNPQQIPNKFFNFLEDEAVNMNMDEEPKNENMVNPNTTLNSEEIELLDFDTPVVPEAKVNYVQEVRTKIDALALDSNKVIVEETEDPIEYIISIKIKKDN